MVRGEEPPQGLRVRSFGPIFLGSTFLQISFICARDEFLFVFVIDVVFRSGKQWGSFDAGERGFIDDGDVE